MHDKLTPSDAGENAPDSEQTTPADRAQARLERINRYADEALKKEDSLVSNLGVITADLLRIACEQQQILASASERSTGSPHREEQIRTAVDDYLRISRQVERYIQLERATEAGKAS